MVSDVLHQALADIEPYMHEPFGYGPIERELIDAMCDHMRTVAKLLDTPPALAEQKQKVKTS